LRGRRRAARTALAAAALLAAGSAARAETVDLVASRSGFRPKVINVRRGENVRFQLTSADGDHCFALEAFRVEKRIRPGRATVVDLTPERAGTFPFYCCLEAGEAAEREHGRLVVTE
jgi:heme/copper-type cytochrome/quinol oxidase subunit 2